jgi:hypothetical protein
MKHQSIKPAPWGVVPVWKNTRIIHKINFIFWQEKTQHFFIAVNRKVIFFSADKHPEFNKGEVPVYAPIALWKPLQYKRIQPSCMRVPIW